MFTLAPATFAILTSLCLRSATSYMYMYSYMYAAVTTLCRRRRATEYMYVTVTSLCLRSAGELCYCDVIVSAQRRPATLL